MKRAATALALLLSSCTRPAPLVDVRNSIGPEGGSVVAPDGTRFDIPPGALSAPTLITLQTATDAPTPPSTQPVGAFYRVGPEGQIFAKPVTATLAFDPTRLPTGATRDSVAIFTAPAGSGRYLSLATTLADGSHARAETSHFSVFTAAVLLDAGGRPLPRPDAGVDDFDGGTGDLAGADLVGSEDLAGADLTANTDLAVAADLAVTPDMAATVDMAVTADMAVNVGADDLSLRTNDMFPDGFFPSPSLTALHPNQAHTGSGDLFVTVEGYGFAADAVVKANGTSLATSIGQMGYLQAVVPASLLGSPTSFPITVVSSSGTSNPLTFTVTSSGNPVPTVTSIDPTSVALGGSVPILTITGTGFSDGSRVFFGGYESMGLAYVSPTQLTVGEVPVTGAAGVYPVVVQTPGPGGGASNANVIFSVTGTNPVPDFTASPSTVPKSSYGMFTLRATSAAHYFTSRTTLTASYGSPTVTVPIGSCYVYGPSCDLSLPYPSLAKAGSVTITANTPAPGGGSGSATITVADGNVLVPNEVRAGSGDLPLVVWGGYTGSELFDAGVSDGGLDFGPSDSYPNAFSSSSVVKAGSTALATRLLQYNQLQAMVPAAMLSAQGTITITVVSGELTSAPITLTITSSGNPLPTVSAISPTSVALGGMLMAGLGIDGSNFLSGARVFLGDREMVGVGSISSTHIDVYPPPEVLGAVASYPVRVLNPAPGGGTNASAPEFAVTGTNPAPSFTASPTVIPVASYAGIQLKATAPDHFFTSRTTVAASWSGGSADLGTCYGYVDACFVNLPYQAVSQAGTVTLTANTPPPGGGSFATDLTVVAGNALQPSEARAGSGTLRLVVWGGYGGASYGGYDGGADLGDMGPQAYVSPYFTQDSVVKADGTPLATTVLEYNRLLAMVPSSMLTGTGSLAITVTTGGNVSSPTPFAVVGSGNPLPVVSSVTPSSAPANDILMGGLTLAGSNFVSGARVYLGGDDVTDSSEVTSAGEVRIYYVPYLVSATVGSYPIVVQNPTPGGGASSGSVSFTVN